MEPPSRPSRDKDEQRRMIEELLSDLQVDTGDVVLFDRKCTSMGLYGGSICVCAKFFGGTQWDHNGVVLKDSATGTLFLMEAALSGVKIRPLVERLQRSASYDIAVRKLQVHRTPEFHARAWEFACAQQDVPYEDRPQRLFNASVAVPQRIERERLFRLLIDTKKELAKLDGDLMHRHNMPEFERNALLKERDAVHERYHAVAAELSQTERSVFENAAAPASKVFCSQLVAALYQHLGLLLPYPSANSYLPKHFSQRGGARYLHLQGGASYLPELSLRRDLEANHARYRRRAVERDQRAPQTSEEVNAIVRCLRRHPLFHTLSESELVDITKHFRRRTLDDGQVVFYQGMQGDYFYILQHGECKVYVNYDHLEQTKTDEDSPESKQPALLLRRRKTLALPDFQNSSSLVGSNERVLVATNGPGSAFGDSALIYGTPRRATLKAVAPQTSAASSSTTTEPVVVAWQLDKQAFRAVVEAHPSSQCSLDEYHFLMQTISEHPLFAALDRRAQALAVRKCFPLHVRKGTTVLAQGDSGDYFYVVESGKCEIARRKPKCEHALVDRVVGAGASFGEAALLYNSRRGATVTALEDTKLWCMDRATFLTITRSGSAALHKLFNKVSSVTKDQEAFVTGSDLTSMLEGANKQHQQQQQQQQSGLAQVVHAAWPDEQGYSRAVKLALALLFHDPSGLVNFSQFAHFHIALSTSNIDQLLPEATFRIVKLLGARYHDNSIISDHSNEFSGIPLRDLPAVLRQWTTGGAAPTSAPATTSELTFYQRLFDAPDAAYVVSYDDLARVFAGLSDDDDSPVLDFDDDDEAMAAVDSDFTAFVHALKRDIAALRTVWRAAEFRIDGAAAEDPDTGKQHLTFDANLTSGWISAIRHNPTAGDWGFLQAEIEPTTIHTDDRENVQAQQTRQWRQATSLAAAIAAGAFSRTACAPLERLKILMQVGPPISVPRTPYTGLFRGFESMVRIGGVRGMYSGNLAHCLWVIPSLPTKFLLCDAYRAQLAKLALFQDPFATDAESNKRRRRWSSDLRNLLAGGLAGLTANCLFYPLDVVRGRLSTQQFASSERRYHGIRDCFRQMYTREGTRAFYRGFAPASLGVFSYIGCNYAIYEFLRPVFILYDTETIASGSTLGHPSVPGQILCATTASVTLQFLSYPFDLVRRRMQVQGAWLPAPNSTADAFPTYTSSWDCVQQTMRAHESSMLRVRALYRGLVVNCVKALPTAVLSFLTFEKIREVKTDDE
ncbi:TPA: hypothetical protein N0F65_011861 [Lagenidium giganteum]|uniref:Cyclic nucleotide-binding domain-containing protein n=1 Tax=Lagenidium giganteum TaxID=4803 RepID=A0AAV2YMD3_9STRA|nr:TPA: hypothetical protein N0F65_011861 [Lagenidium giganteum]